MGGFLWLTVEEQFDGSIGERHSDGNFGPFDNISLVDSFTYSEGNFPLRTNSG